MAYQDSLLAQRAQQGRGVQPAQQQQQPLGPRLAQQQNSLPAQARPPQVDLNRLSSLISPGAFRGSSSKKGPLSFWQDDEKRGAIVRAALAGGSALLRQTDPKGENPFTQISTGLLTGLNTYDRIKEQQRGINTRRQLAGIDPDQSSAQYAGEVGRTLAGQGNIQGALGAFKTQAVLTPTPATAPKLRTVSPGQGVYDPGAGTTVTPITKAPEKKEIKQIGNELYEITRTKQGTTAKKITTGEKPREEITLAPGATRYAKDKNGVYQKVAAGKERIRHKPTNKEKERTVILKNIEDIVRDRHPLIKTHDGLGYPIEGAKLEKAYRDAAADVTRRQEQIDAGIITQREADSQDQVFGPGGANADQGTTTPDTVEIPTYEEFSAYQKSINPGTPDELIESIYEKRYLNK